MWISITNSEPAKLQVYNQCTDKKPCGVGDGSCQKQSRRCKKGLICSRKKHLGCNGNVEKLPNVFCCIGKYKFIVKYSFAKL